MHSKEIVEAVRALSSTMTLDRAAEEIGITPQQIRNIAYYRKISFRKRGEQHYNSKLDNSDIPLIRELFDSGITKAEIARKFEVHPSMICKIITGKARIYD